MTSSADLNHTHLILTWLLTTLTDQLTRDELRDQQGYVLACCISVTTTAVRQRWLLLHRPAPPF